MLVRIIENLKHGREVSDYDDRRDLLNTGPHLSILPTLTMSAVLQTPPRPVPGTYVQTPASHAPSFHSAVSQPTRPSLASQQIMSRSETTTRPSQPTGQAQQVKSTTSSAAEKTVEALRPAERASRTITETLESERRFPELDSYLSQGFSCEYDLQTSAPWAPFQKIRTYDLPDQIFAQYNHAQMSTSMGLFAEIHHAWVTIDDALYMWDYAVPNPAVLGYESQSGTITAVKLAIPRAGVFLSSIKNTIVLATVSEVLLLGLGTEEGTGGSTTLTLFETGMAVSSPGIIVQEIASSANGRIFFGGNHDVHVYEMRYQQEEKWFTPRCSKTCHTSGVLGGFALPYGWKSKEFVAQMVVDDTRDLLYTLSSISTIRVFHMTPDGSLTLVLTKLASDVYSNVGHIITANEALNLHTRIISISPIPAHEAFRYHLVATTATGYRLYLSATGPNSWSSTKSSTPMNMQAQHVKTPPLLPQKSLNSSQQPVEHVPGVNSPIRSLIQTRSASRYPPGYFFCLTSDGDNPELDTLFISAPDAGRLVRQPEAGQPSRSSESAIRLSLGSRAEDIGLSSSYHPPTATPTGYGNELAVQFDHPSPEIAILTNTGVHIFRRRRLVDIFAALIQNGGGPEGIDGEIRIFIRNYGRTETLATALAVACGQGVEVSPEARVARIHDPKVLEVALRTFIDYGGKPVINQNAIADPGVAAIDTVRPSPRYGGTALYLSRLLRSTWKMPVARELRTPAGLSVLPNVPLPKLRSVQEDLSALRRFFQSNRTAIRGLTGPDSAATRPGNKQEEMAWQGEHRAMHALVKFVSDTIEGLSFVLVLFEERMEEIVLLLPEQSRPLFFQLTFQELFSTKKGLDLAKELVKAIVDRNIAKGSNVETVAEALRRRCGTFCSANDVIIFKAQEQLKRASEAGANAEYARNLLNESLSLFQQVAENLPQDTLASTVRQFTNLQFFAGAIQLVLKVAHDADRGNEALSWIHDGRPEGDPRKAKYDHRSQCYDLVHQVIAAVDEIANQAATSVDGRPTLSTTRRNEAYDVIGRSTDEAFLSNLYDWYLSQGWIDRLLATDSPFIVTYLRRRSVEDVGHADLLWRYYGLSGMFYEAARVQLQLARSDFPLPLDRRIEYLSRARAHASTSSPGTNRKAKQKLMSEITEFLEVANIQDEILQRLKDDVRLPPERRADVLNRVNGPILSTTEVWLDPSSRTDGRRADHIASSSTISPTTRPTTTYAFSSTTSPITGTHLRSDRRGSSSSRRRTITPKRVASRRRGKRWGRPSGVWVLVSDCPKVPFRFRRCSRCWRSTRSSTNGASHRRHGSSTSFSSFRCRTNDSWTSSRRCSTPMKRPSWV